ncbi:MAG: lysophospholipid acyltransferase family protein [Pseudomonadota bacterium]
MIKAFSALHKTYSILRESYVQSTYLTDDFDERVRITTNWGKTVFNRLNMEVDVQGDIVKDPGTLFVGNHVSYLDIPLLMGTVPGVSFVAKHEIKHWPIFGPGATKINTVYVKRGKGASRKEAARVIRESIDNGSRVAIFPSGTTSIDGKKQWRKGAFEIAESNQCWVQPFRMVYSPLRPVAYIDDDFFPTHLYRLFALDQIKTKIEFHEPVKIKDPIQDCLKWQNWAQETLKDSLN